VAIPKPGKRDKSNPRSYRLIALLSVLGKGLERLVARRLAWVAVREKVLHPQQFGALPGRSATDLAAAVVHDVEEALLRGKVASMLTLDIKGAFDAVLPGRLVQRLKQQGWPDNLVRWVSCFTTQRSASLRLDDEAGAYFQVPSGLPQGSPVSPILFMLFIQPLFLLGNKERRRARLGYADDVALLTASDSLEGNGRVLSRDVGDIMQWARQEGLTFDTKKTELIHFSRKKSDENPALLLQLAEGEHVVEPTAIGGSMRWLGVWFDRKLSFKAHVGTLAAKAKRTAAGIKALGNTVRGAPPKLLCRAVQACVQPTLCYGSEAWWPGISRLRGGRQVSNRVDSLVRKLDTVQNEALRGVLPVYKTTPIPALHREAAMPPVQIILDHRAALAAARMKRLDARHPLVRRVTKHREYTYETRLVRMAAKAGHTEPHDPLASPPWEPKVDRSDARIGYAQGLTAEEAAAGFTSWAAARGQRDLVVYTDGSQVTTPKVAAGAGWAICQGPGHPIVARGRLPMPRAEVFDAEATAALRGLQEASASVRAEFADNLYICLDNLEVARSLTHRTTTSSQEVFAAFVEAARQWSNRQRRPHTRPGRVVVRWVPGHRGVPGNEAADAEAKAAAAEAAAAGEEAAGAVATLAYTRRRMKEGAAEAFRVYWLKQAPARYRNLGIKLRKKPPELDLPRFTLGKLYACRTGHGDFAVYHRRLGHEGAATVCHCGRDKAPEHFFYCRLGRRAARQPWGSLRVQDILSTQEGARMLDGWLAKSGYFRRVCPPHPSPRTLGEACNS